MPKIFRFITGLHTILIVFFLSSCGSQSVLTLEPTLENVAVVDITPTLEASHTPTPEATAEPTATATPTGIQPADLDGIRLNFWHPWTGNKEFAILTMVNKFNAKNEFGIVVTAFSQGSDLYQGIRAGINAGMLPHMAAGFTNQIQSWDNHGDVIIDMNHYIDDPNWGLSSAEQTAFFPEFWNQDVINGKRLGLPAYRSAMLLFYNQTWAEDLGFDQPPTTPDEFKKQACAAAQNNGSGGWIANTDPSTIMSWIYAFGGAGIASDGDGYDFNTPETQEAFDFIKGLFKTGCAWIPEAYYPNDEFATRQGLFYASSIAGILYQGFAMEDHSSTDQWTVIPFPSKDGDPVLSMSGAAYTIFASSEEEELATWLFIKWLTAPENQSPLIEEGGYFPTHPAAYSDLEKYAVENPQWAQAQDLIPFTRTEPGFGSWGIVRWAIRDAANELVNPNFASEDIALLVETLDETVTEIHLENR